jgi:hypothetical protein
MVNSPERFAIAKWVPALLVGGLLAALAAAVFVVLASRAASADRGFREHLSDLTVLAGAMPAQAAAAGRGDASAHERLAASRATLERVLGEIEAGRSPFAALSSESARRLGGETGWNILLESSQQVLAARQVAPELKKSAAESRATLGRVLAATGNAVSAPGGLPAMRVLPRFETVAQRTSDDLEQLEAAQNPAGVTQRVTENTALLAQFLAGLAGLDKTAGVPTLEGEAATRLGEVQGAFADYEKQLQATLEQAAALATAQRAAADLGAAADRLSKALDEQSAGEAGGSAGTAPALFAIARSGPGLRKPACGASRASNRSATAATRTRSSGCSTRCRASPRAT